ncbi:hypothetical protein ACFLYM_00700 [Chloroflexota bacterium]
MKTVGTFMALILIIIAVLLVSCGEEQVEFNSDYIHNVAMAADIDEAYKPQKITYTFDTDTPRIYCTFQVIAAPVGTSVSAEWIYIEGAASVQNYIIDSLTQLIEGDQNTAMYINRLPNGWPSGDYKVILYINGEPQGSVPFKVK